MTGWQPSGRIWCARTRSFQKIACMHTYDQTHVCNGTVRTTTATTTITTSRSEFKVARVVCASDPFSLEHQLLTCLCVLMAPLELLQGGDSDDCVLSDDMSSSRSQWPSQQPSTTTALDRRRRRWRRGARGRRRRRYTRRTLPYGEKAPPLGTRPGLPPEPAPQVRLEVGCRWSADFCLACTGVGRRGHRQVRSPFPSSSSWRRGSRRKRRSSRWTSP